MKLSTSILHEAFTELGELAFAEGKVIDIAIYGGSALMLASNFRISTRDVDAVAERDDATLRRLSDIVASRRGWPKDWLNDGVRTYLSPNVEGLAQHHELFRTYPGEQRPGLRVFVPTAEYLLAMKLMAMRLDPGAGKSDLGDILSLLDIVGIKSPEEAIAFASTFYPEARVSGRLLLGVREIWRHKAALQQGHRHEQAPAYLGRSR